MAFSLSRRSCRTGSWATGGLCHELLELLQCGPDSVTLASRLGCLAGGTDGHGRSKWYFLPTKLLSCFAPQQLTSTCTLLLSSLRPYNTLEQATAPLEAIVNNMISAKCNTATKRSSSRWQCSFLHGLHAYTVSTQLRGTRFTQVCNEAHRFGHHLRL